MRLRIGYLPDSLPASVPRALRNLNTVAPRIQVQLETGPALRLIDEVRARRLDAAVVALPAPTRGLRTKLLDHQRIVAVLPASHRHARAASIALDRLAPERLVLLPRDANPAFNNAVAAICHVGGLSPTLVETEAPRVEDALLAVSAGAGIALLPESVTERYASPGIRFVPVETEAPAFQNAVLTHPNADSMATGAFLRALTQAGRIEDRRTDASESVRSAVSLVA
jgi:DNA-binding transcriptional LysR family regulator